MFYVSPDNSTKIVEAFVGEYASGKSEISINRALELKTLGRSVNLVDLDTVEPFYTLRPIKDILEQKGLKVIGFSSKDTFGLGETGAMLNPQARWALRREGDVILDVGYGVFGARTLKLVEGADESPDLRVIAVINYTRPMTGSYELIKEYVINLGRVDAIVANTHLGDETTIDIVKKGNTEIINVAADLGLPVDFIAMDEKLRGSFEQKDFQIPIKFIHRYMPSARW